MKNMNDNADTIETAELDKVVADVLNYDNMMNVDMYIDECLKEININQLQSNELDLVKILEEQNESSRRKWVYMGTVYMHNVFR